MIRYMDRDLIRTFLMTFLTVLAFVQIGVFVSVLLEKAQYIFGGTESKLGWVLLYYVATIPRQAAYTIPVGTAVSILWLYTVKARHNELLAYFVGGVSPVRLAAPMIILSLVLSVSSFFTIEYLASAGDSYAQSVERIQIEERNLETLTRESNVFQKGQGNRFYNIRTFDPISEKMELPIIFDMGTDWTRADWRLEASTAERVQSDGKAQWVFHDAVFRRWNDDGTIVEFLSEAELSESRIGVQLEAELTQYLRQRFRPSQMRLGELLDYIHLFELQGKPTYELEAYVHFNFAIPFGSLVLALLMCGHILRPSASGMIVGFGGGLILISVYYVVLITGQQLAKGGAINPILAAWGPTVAFLLLGLVLLNRYRPN